MTETLVIGAGPAGLAVAASLRGRGLPVVVVDRGDAVASSWRNHYDRLHLHTMRAASGLPGMAIPRRYGRWVSRADVVSYLESYAAANGIEPRFGVRVQHLDRSGARWRATTPEETLEADVVVVAGGRSHTPFVPAWPGREGFSSTLLHSTAYRSGAAYRGRRVLVVGAGNSGAEIAVDLAEAGADVALAVRTGPQIVPRSVLGVPAQLFGLLLRRAPALVGDLASKPLQAAFVGDLRPFGMPQGPGGVFSNVRGRDALPLLDVGLVRELRRGRVRVLPAVVGFDGADVLLADGGRYAADVVVAATGFRPGLEPLVGHLGVLAPDGTPVVHGATTSPAAPGLHFIGYTTPISGHLRELGIDARRIAAAVTAAR